jgi:hypothetical protein
MINKGERLISFAANHFNVDVSQLKGTNYSFDIKRELTITLLHYYGVDTVTICFLLNKTHKKVKMILEQELYIDDLINAYEQTYRERLDRT